jgi:hypothetical protein
MSRKNTFLCTPHHWLSKETATASFAVGDLALDMVSKQQVKDNGCNFHVTEKVALMTVVDIDTRIILSRHTS